MSKNEKSQKSAEAEASSAHSAVNIPINVENWSKLDQPVQDELLWYHQHLLNEKIGWGDIKKTIGYDRSTVYRVLKGTYEGSYENIVERIREYRKSIKLVQRSEFAENRISKLISSTLDYAVICEGIVEVIGESGQGKTEAGRDWAHRHNSGRTNMVEIPPTGGHRGFLRAMCSKVGANKNQSVIQMEASILRAYSPRRVLILDEAHRLIPTDRRSNPTSIEFIRYLHDTTGVPIGILVTGRFDNQLRKAEYMFEQVIGRIDLRVKLPQEMDYSDYGPMLEQYIEEPSPKIQSVCDEVVNKWEGRMRSLNKLLKFASRIASKKKETMEESHVFQALAWRDKLQKGEI